MIKKEQFLKNTLFIIIPFLLFLVICEIIVRLLSIDVIQDEPYFFGFNGCPEYFLQKTQDSILTYHTNPDKDIEKTSFPLKKSANDFRIFTLGGSAAYGEPFGPEGSFSRWLQDRLNTLNPSTNYQVINCARRGFGSVRVLNIFDEIIEYQPDLVLIYFGNNEYRDYLFHRIEINIDIQPLFRKIKFILDHSHIFRMFFHTFFKKKLTSFGAESINNVIDDNTFNEAVFSQNLSFLEDRRRILDVTHGGHWISKLDSTTLTKLNSDSLMNLINTLNWMDIWPDKFQYIFNKNINTMIEKAKGKNIPILFLTRARNFYYNHDARLLFEKFDDANQIIIQTCRENDIRFFETLSVLKNHYNDEIGFNAFVDIVHPTLATNQIIANKIADEMRSMNLLNISHTTNLIIFEQNISQKESLEQINFPYNSQYYSLIGWQKLICLNAYEHTENTIKKEIMELANKALELDPYNEKAYLLLGTLYSTTMDVKSMKNVWEKMRSQFSFIKR
jgi:hypothetical protein